MTLAEFRREVYYTLAKSEDVDWEKYKTRFYTATSNAQKSISEIAIIKREKSIVQNLSEKDNLIDDPFSVRQHSTEDIVLGEGIAKEYFYQTSAPSTVYLEENINDTWVVLDTFVNSNQGYEQFGGSIDSTHPVRLRFSGNDYYDIRNIALLNIETPGMVGFGRYAKYEIPDKTYLFWNLRYISDSGDIDDTFSDYISSEDKFIMFPVYLKGEFIFEYAKYPDRLYYLSEDDKTLDDYELEVNDSAQRIMIDGVAAALKQNDYDLRYFTNYFSKFEGEKANVLNPFPTMVKVTRQSKGMI